MSSPPVQRADRAVGSMSRLLTAAETSAVNTDDKNLVTCAQDKTMATDNGSIGNQPTNVADVPTIDGAATASHALADLSISTAKPSAEVQPPIPDTNHCDFLSGVSDPATTKPEQATPNQIIASNSKPDSEPPCTTVASTEPVGIYYKPRRPNIFRVRAKHLQWERNPVATDSLDKPEGVMEDVNDGEEFTMEELEELNSTMKQQMDKKTESFKRMVQQTVWHSRVEDLGSVQEIEE